MRNYTIGVCILPALVFMSYIHQTYSRELTKYYIDFIKKISSILVYSIWIESFVSRNSTSSVGFIFMVEFRHNWAVFPSLNFFIKKRSTLRGKM